MKKHVLLFLCILSYCSINAQITFQKTYSGPDYDQAFATHQTPDGGYIIAGNTNMMLTTGASHIFLIKTNTTGDTSWTKTYTVALNVTGADMQRTPDGGYIIAGTTYDVNSIDGDPVLIKTDVNGDTLWTKIYKAPGDQGAAAVALTPDGGYIITGSNNDNSATTPVFTSVLLMKVDHNGTMVWLKSFTNTYNKWVNSVAITSDGGCIVSGRADSSGTTGREAAYLLKTDSMGNTIWSKIYYSYNSNRGYCVKQASDGGYIVTGQTYVPVNSFANINHIYLFKTDANGDLLWSKKFGGCCNDFANAVTESNDHGYVITGLANSFTGNGLYVTNLFIIKTAENGVVSWCRYYGTGGNDNEGGSSIEQTADHGYMVSGLTSQNGNDVYLVKTDSAGNSSCNGYSYPLYDSAFTTVMDTIQAILAPLTFVASALAPAVSHFGYVTYDPCLSTGIADVTDLPAINIYPNPGKGAYTMSGLAEGDVIEIYDLNGNRIYHTVAENNMLNMDISDRSPGMYFYKRTDKKGKAVRGKIILQ